MQSLDTSRHFGNSIIIICLIMNSPNYGELTVQVDYVVSQVLIHEKAYHMVTNKACTTSDNDL